MVSSLHGQAHHVAPDGLDGVYSLACEKSTQSSHGMAISSHFTARLELGYGKIRPFMAIFGHFMVVFEPFRAIWSHFEPPPHRAPCAVAGSRSRPPLTSTPSAAAASPRREPSRAPRPPPGLDFHRFSLLFKPLSLFGPVFVARARRADVQRRSNRVQSRSVKRP